MLKYLVDILADADEDKINDNPHITTLGSGGDGEIYKISSNFLQSYNISLLSNNNDIAFKYIYDEIEEILKHKYVNDNSDNILQYYNYYFYQNNADDSSHIFIFMPLASCDINKFLHNNPNLTYPQKLELVYKMCLALNDLHLINFRHGDVKPANFLIFGNIDNYTVKLCDFARGGIFNYEFNFSNNCTEQYLSYDELMLDYKDGIKLNLATDIWSLAISMIEVMTYNNNHKYVLYQKVEPSDANFTMKLIECNEDYKCSIKDGLAEVSNDFADFILKMLNIDQHARSNIKQVLQHPLFKSFDTSANLSLTPTDNDSILNIEQIINILISRYKNSNIAKERFEQDDLIKNSCLYILYFLCSLDDTYIDKILINYSKNQIHTTVFNILKQVSFKNLFTF